MNNSFFFRSAKMKKRLSLFPLHFGCGKIERRHCLPFLRIYFYAKKTPSRPISRRRLCLYVRCYTPFFYICQALFFKKFSQHGNDPFSEKNIIYCNKPQNDHCGPATGEGELLPRAARGNIGKDDQRNADSKENKNKYRIHVSSSFFHRFSCLLYHNYAHLGILFCDLMLDKIKK